jgi:CHASE2 domain-containing sensor protein
MGLWQVGIWNSIELLGFNVLFPTRNLFPHPDWDDRIAVIGIDDKTLSEYGEFPLSRDRYAQLLDTLAASPPAAIGFDILFVEPTIHDATLADAIDFQFHGQVVIGVAPTVHQKTLNPVPTLSSVAFKGNIGSNADLDGVTREYYLYANEFPSLSIQLLKIYNQSLKSTFTSPDQNINQSLIEIPSSQSEKTEKDTQSVWINWIKPTHEMPTYSFIDVVKGKVESSKLKNKIILIGFTATGAKDILKTPFEQTPPTSGVYVHAAIIDNILNQRLLQKLSWQWELLLLVMIGIGSSFIIIPLQVYQRIFIIICLPITWFILSVITLANFHLWLPTIAPIGTIFLAALTVQWQEQKEKEQLMSLFARHVSPETADLIWEHRAEIFQYGELEPQEMIATVLFSDIRSFTSISEGMIPKELLNWLNCYLGAMAKCVHQHQGVIDKYIGDAVMAVFGIPFPHHQQREIEKDAISAVSAAIAMQERLISLNQELDKLGKPRIYIGIGLHTGLVVAGSIGGSDRLNYSVLGDAVNIAARLEQLNKNVQQQNPYRILISETTFQLVKNHFTTKKVQEIQLRGREQLTMIYAITGRKNSSN